MLSDGDFQNWCDRLGLSDEAKEQIQIIRSSQPSRKVGGASEASLEGIQARKWV